VFGVENACATITVVKTAGLGAAGLPIVSDVVLWYARDKTASKYRQVFSNKGGEPESLGEVLQLLHADMRLKEQALARTAPPDVKPDRYRPPDQRLAFLERL
jgi:hypothetical protein